jgi:iron(III) transport system ATP-binding protein
MGGLTTGGLEVDEVSHDYGRLRALDGVSLAIGAGEVVCLLGPSGCGKTTLLRVAAGLEPLQAGRISIGGQVVADPRRALDLPPEERGVGMVFQDYALFPHLTVLDNVAFGLRRLPRGERRARARAVLEQVGMDDRAGDYPHTLSGGQQQRVALARALAPGPPAMLLDEPFAGLDTRLRQRVREDALRVLKASGAAVLLVTHDPEEAMAMGDRLAVMRDGRIEQVGPPAAVYGRPASAFVAEFLGETNRLVGVVEAGAVATPLGQIPTDRLADGLAVAVLVRPESLRLELPNGEPGEGAIPALVDAVRLIGAQAVVDVRLLSSGGEGHRLRALQIGPTELAPQDVVKVRLDPRLAFVFPVEPDLEEAS